MPADRELVPRVEHHVGRIRPGQRDHRPLAEHRGYLRGRIHSGTVLDRDVQVDVGKLVPAARAHRAEHHDRTDPVVAGVVCHDVTDEVLVCMPAEPCHAWHASRDIRFPA
jgi:hypothetical protein